MHISLYSIVFYRNFDPRSILMVCVPMGGFSTGKKVTEPPFALREAQRKNLWAMCIFIYYSTAGQFFFHMGDQKCGNGRLKVAVQLPPPIGIAYKTYTECAIIKYLISSSFSFATQTRVFTLCSYMHIIGHSFTSAQRFHLRFFLIAPQ